MIVFFSLLGVALLIAWEVAVWWEKKKRKDRDLKAVIERKFKDKHRGIYS